MEVNANFHAPATLTPEKESPVPNGWRLDGPPETVLMLRRRKIPCPCWEWNPDY
jgi:hypothetical protein